MEYKRKVLADIDVKNLRKMLEDCNADKPQWLQILDPLCYFCGGPPIFVYAGDCTPGGTRAETWRWCACESCSAEIEKENWAYLERRIVDWMVLHTGWANASVKKSARVLLEDFPAHAIKLSKPRKRAQRAKAANA
jgi:hypothetical protein